LVQAKLILLVSRRRRSSPHKQAHGEDCHRNANSRGDPADPTPIAHCSGLGALDVFGTDTHTHHAASDALHSWDVEHRLELPGCFCGSGIVKYPLE
jgi:hypothetical protein